MKAVKKTRIQSVDSHFKVSGQSLESNHYRQSHEPLFIIFEHQLYHFDGSDDGGSQEGAHAISRAGAQAGSVTHSALISKVIQDYFAFLEKHHIIIPKALLVPTVDELTIQIRNMLMKKIYGSHSIQEFRKTLSTKIRQLARTRYVKLIRAG